MMCEYFPLLYGEAEVIAEPILIPGGQRFFYSVLCLSSDGDFAAINWAGCCRGQYQFPRSGRPVPQWYEAGLRALVWSAPSRGGCLNDGTFCTGASCHSGENDDEVYVGKMKNDNVPDDFAGYRSRRC